MSHYWDLFGQTTPASRHYGRHCFSPFASRLYCLTIGPRSMRHSRITPSQYLPRHASYDLKKLRGKQWVHKIGNSRRYEPTSDGLKLMTALLTLREKVIKPVLASLDKTKRGPKLRGQSELDIQYGKVQAEMQTLFHILGFVVSEPNIDNFLSI